MPPAAVGAAFVAIGASAATGAAVATFVAAVYVGAAIGAVVGAATSLITGGNILEGAIKGAVIGGITRGVGSFLGPASTAGTAVGGVGEAGTGAIQAGEAGLSAGTAAGSTAGTITSEGATFAIGEGLSNAGNVVANTPAATGGVLSKMGGWIEANPSQAAIASQAIGGAAKGMYESRASKKEIDALMERDRLNRDALRVGGLSDITTRPTLPTISGFLEKPKWQLDDSGLLPVRTNQ